MTIHSLTVNTKSIKTSAQITSEQRHTFESALDTVMSRVLNDSYIGDPSEYPHVANNLEKHLAAETLRLRYGDLSIKQFCSAMETISESAHLLATEPCAHS
ncbi:MAG: hypothetical protein DI585_01310 [Pseudomonas fluorescens]|nr:MAG: hypothetical protein DI585_01310 [Pseudomonas fluorescens]